MSGDATVRGTKPLDPNLLKQLPQRVEQQGQQPANQPDGNLTTDQRLQPQQAKMAADRRAKTGPLTGVLPTGDFSFDAPAVAANATNPANPTATTTGNETPTGTTPTASDAHNALRLGTKMADAMSDVGRSLAGALNATRETLGSVSSVGDATATATDVAATTTDIVANAADTTRDLKQLGQVVPTEATTGMGRVLGGAAVLTGAAMTASAVGNFLNGNATVGETMLNVAEGAGTALTGAGDMLGKVVGTTAAGTITPWAAASGVGAVVMGGVAVYRGVSTLASGVNAEGQPLSNQEKASAGLDAASGAFAMAAGVAMMIPGGQPVAAALGMVSGALALTKLAVDNWDSVKAAAADPIGTAANMGKAVGSWVSGAASSIGSWFGGGNNTPAPAPT